MREIEASFGPLLHMLGLDREHRAPWRNCFVGGPGHHDNADLERLVGAGLIVVTRRPGFLDPSDVVYRATDAGVRAAVEHNQRVNPPPRRSEARYLFYLRVADAYADLSFGQFLKRRLYDDARRDA